MPIRPSELICKNASAWRTWLSQNGLTSTEAWLVCAKKTSSKSKSKPKSNTETNTTPPPTSLTYDQALDEALCFGWVDSGGGKRDEMTHYYRFTPRKAKSMWSARNVGYIKRLEGLGKMAPQGILVVDNAKANGLWEVAYSAEAPKDLLDAIELAGEEVQEAWERMSKKDKYSLFVRSGGAPMGTENRVKKIGQIVDSLSLKASSATVFKPSMRPSTNKGNVQESSKLTQTGTSRRTRSSAKES